jgi:hypothetical protein
VCELGLAVQKAATREECCDSRGERIFYRHRIFGSIAEIQQNGSDKVQICVAETQCRHIRHKWIVKVGSNG